MQICTIVARNYLAAARVLARSFRAQHPGGKYKEDLWQQKGRLQFDYKYHQHLPALELMIPSPLIPMEFFQTCAPYQNIKGHEENALR